MSANTKIEWADATVNWWAGCTAISPACDNCYAKRMAGRLWGVQWGPGQPRLQFTGPLEALHTLDRKAKRLGRPLRVFHNSLSDFFDNEAPAQWRISALSAMLETRHLIHLVLTKRIGNAAAMLETGFRAVHAGREGWADNVPPHIWIGATICNQEEADRDITKLMAVPAAKRFLSVEPMLNNVESNWLQFMDWVIVGGESGPNARPMHPNWARSLRDQCQTAGVQFFFKQWGEWAPRDEWSFHIAMHKQCAIKQDGSAVGDDDTPQDVGGQRFELVGKKAAGRLLDGREWNEVPL